MNIDWGLLYFSGLTITSSIFLLRLDWVISKEEMSEMEEELIEENDELVKFFGKEWLITNSKRIAFLLTVLFWPLFWILMLYDKISPEKEK